MCVLLIIGSTVFSSEQFMIIASTITKVAKEVPHKSFISHNIYFM